MSTHTPFSVAYGGVSNTRTTQSPEDATLEYLYREYHEPTPVDMDVGDYHEADKKTKGSVKKALPYFVGGTLKGRRHDDQVLSRTLLTLDVEQGEHDDTPPPHPRFVVSKLKELGGAGWVYTSLSHTSESPRYRVVLPLGEPITGADMQAALEASTRAAAKRLGIDEWTKPESWVLSQPMYLPARLTGGTFYQALSKGKSWKSVGASATKAGNEHRASRAGLADIPDDGTDEVLGALKKAGLYLKANDRHKGMHFITCPCADQHETENDSKTVYYEAHFDGNPRPAVKCMSTSHDEVTYTTLVRYLRERGILSKDKTGVLDDYDTFDAKADLGHMLDEEPTAREWAINQFAPVGKVTVLAGPGGVSKSMLMLHMLVHAAMEQEWGGFRCDEALRSLYVSYEDDRQELHKRINALATALRESDDGVLDTLYDVNGTIRRNLRVFAADDEAAEWLLLTKPDRFAPPERTERVEWLVGYLRAKHIKCLVLDPAVYTHQLEENNIADMAVFMQTLTAVAKQAQCAVIVLHHMNKTGAWAQLDDINQGSLRGASSFADNARSVAVVVTMPSKDAEAYGVVADEAGKLAVFKHVKHNYSAPLPTLVLERRGALLLPRAELVKLGSAQVQEARDAAKEADATRRVVMWADKVLAALKEYTESVSLAQLAHDLNTRTNRLKPVMDHCIANDWVDMEHGERNAQLHKITKTGRSYLRAGTTHK